MFEPVFPGELGDRLVGVEGDLGQDVLEVVEGIDAPLAAGLDDGEEDGATLAAITVADEEPIFLAHGGRTDGGLPRCARPSDCLRQPISAAAPVRPSCCRFPDGCRGGRGRADPTGPKA